MSIDDMDVSGNEAKERRRVRELLRYYHPIDFRVERLDGASSESRTELPHDTILTGLAQLGVHKTGCQRAYITLADSDYQYVLAEATRDGGLAPSSTLGGGPTYLGPSIIEKSRALCPGAINIFSRDDQEWSTGPNLVADSTRYIVNDLSQEQDYKDKTYVTQWPKMRFYAEVPIVCMNGYVLGSYCISDDQPRNGLDEHDVVYLQEVAGAIMVHLESIRAQNLHTRSERLIQGLGLFVEGKSSLREWWLGESDHLSKSTTMSIEAKRHDLVERADKEFGAPPRPDSAPQITRQALKEESASHVRSSSSAPFSQEDDNTTQSLLSGTRETKETTPMTTPMPSSQADYFPGRPRDMSRSIDSGSVNAPFENDPIDGQAPPRTQASKTNPFEEVETNPEVPLEDKSRAMFSRASNLVREALELEGVVFLDACWSDTDKGGNHSKLGVVPEDGDVHESSSSSNTSDEEARSMPAFQRHLPYQGSIGGNQGSSDNDKCQVLGYSTRVKSSYAGNATTSSTPTMAQRRLRKLLSKYAYGTLFSFDQQGVVTSSDDDNEIIKVANKTFKQVTRSNEKKKTRRQRDGETLLKMVPGARSVVFLPLWDYRKERWLAGTIAWTSDETRVLEESHLTYFMAFGNSIMAELTRLEALAADRAKSNFIASISHELRSPLHGILGSAELLQDTETTAGQDDMIRMIEICGRTLLDTTEHVLEFAKINNLRPDNKLKDAGGRQSLAAERTSAFHLAEMVEDVIDCVFAGHSHQNSASSLYYMTEGSKKAVKPKSARQGFASHSNAVGAATQSALEKTMITIDIDKSDNWFFYSQPGAWKRILMNLFGNALKYTEKGSIVISLRCRKRERSPSDITTPDRSDISLCVYDTGRGISSEYLKHRLYRPFSQENELSVGTGLGLSIVKQVASSIGATVSLKSEVGVGTQVELSAVLEQAMPGESLSSPFHATLSRAASQSHGRSVSLVGFDLLPDISQPVTGVMDSGAQQLLYLKSALKNLATEWMGMRVIPVAALAADRPDMLIVHESQLQSLEGLDLGQVGESLVPTTIPTIVLCCQVGKPKASTPSRIYVNHPFGLQKVAEVIRKCLRLPPTYHTDPSWAVHQSKDDTQEISIRPSRPTFTTSQRFSTYPGPSRPSRSRSSTTSGEPGGPRILIVDDNEINLKLLAGFMKKLRYSHVTATDGLQAVNAYRAASPKFAVILMDLSMPVMDGVTATREIRKIKQEEHEVPCVIIACTGLGSNDAKEEAMSSGMDMYLTKPVSFKKLKGVIESALDGSALGGGR